MQCLVDDRGVNVFHPQAPSATALVLLHGACQDHRAWTPLLEPLRRSGVDVWAPDLPGHGGSAGPPCTSIAAMAAWVLRLLDACGIARCALAGHSMGSLVALHAAALAPQRVTAVGLVGSAWPMRVAPRLLELARTDPDAALQRVARASHAERDGQPVDAAALADTLALMREVQRGGGPASLLALDLQACDAWLDLPELAPRVRAEVGFMLGRDDRMTPPAQAQTLQQAFPRAWCEILDSGHALMAEAPQALARALLRLPRD